MATLSIDIQSQNRARRQLLDTRQQIQEINVQLTKNAAEYLKADDAQKSKLRTDRAELTLSRRRLSNSAAQVRIYQAETREIERLAREKQKLNRVANSYPEHFKIYDSTSPVHSPMNSCLAYRTSSPVLSASDQRPKPRAPHFGNSQTTWKAHFSD